MTPGKFTSSRLTSIFYRNCLKHCWLCVMISFWLILAKSAIRCLALSCDPADGSSLNGKTFEVLSTAVLLLQVEADERKKQKHRKSIKISASFVLFQLGAWFFSSISASSKRKKGNTNNQSRAEVQCDEGERKDAATRRVPKLFSFFLKKHLLLTTFIVCSRVLFMLVFRSAAELNYAKTGWKRSVEASTERQSRDGTELLFATKRLGTKAKLEKTKNFSQESHTTRIQTCAREIELGNYYSN